MTKAAKAAQPAFHKGQQVTYIADWDRKGTVTYRDATVFSCGFKQLILTCSITGEELGRNFRPEMGSILHRRMQHGNMISNIAAGGTFPRMTAREAEATALLVAQSILAYEREWRADCIARSTDPAYRQGMQASIEELHEPRAIPFPTRQPI